MGPAFNCPKTIDYDLLGTVTSKYRSFLKL